VPFRFATSSAYRRSGMPCGSVPLRASPREASAVANIVHRSGLASKVTRLAQVARPPSTSNSKTRRNTMALIRVLSAGIAMSTLAFCGSVAAQSSGGQHYDEPMHRNFSQGGQQAQQMSPGEVRSYFRQVENQINQAVQSGDPQRLHQWTQNNIADGAHFQAVITMGGQNGLGGSREIRILSFSKNDLLRRQQAALSLAPELLSKIENYDFGIRVQNIQPIGDSAAVVRTRISESGTIGGNAPGHQLGAAENGGNQGLGTQGMGNQDMGTPGMGTPGMGTQGLGPGRNLSKGGDQDQAQEHAQNDEQNEGRNEAYQNGAGGRFQQRMAEMRGQMRGQTGQQQGVSFNADAECTQLVQRDPNSGRLTIGLSNCNAEMQF
jgi:hypothetical protein